MRTVDVGIGHNYNFAVAKFFNIEIGADICTESSYNRLKFIVAVNFINSCFFNVKHFTPERKYCLKASVTALFCRTTRRVTLDDIDFGKRVISELTVCKFTGKRCRIGKCRFSCGFSCFTCGFSCTTCVECFFYNCFCDRNELKCLKISSF